MDLETIIFLIVPNNWLDFVFLGMIALDIVTLTKFPHLRSIWKVVFVTYMVSILAIALYAALFFFGWLIPGFDNYDAIFGDNPVFAPVRFIFSSAGEHLHYFLFIIVYLGFVQMTQERIRFKTTNTI